MRISNTEKNSYITMTIEPTSTRPAAAAAGWENGVVDVAAYATLRGNAGIALE